MKRFWSNRGNAMVIAVMIIGLAYLAVKFWKEIEDALSSYPDFFFVSTAVVMVIIYVVGKQDRRQAIIRFFRRLVAWWIQGSSRRP